MLAGQAHALVSLIKLLTKINACYKIFVCLGNERALNEDFKAKLRRTSYCSALG